MGETGYGGPGTPGQRLLRSRTVPGNQHGAGNLNLRNCYRLHVDKSERNVQGDPVNCAPGSSAAVPPCFRQGRKGPFCSTAERAPPGEASGARERSSCQRGKHSWEARTKSRVEETETS